MENADASFPPPIQDQTDPAEAKWPIVFGIIAIVFGVFALLQALLSIVMIKAQAGQFEVMKEEGMAIPENYFEELSGHTNNQAIGLSCIALILLVGGIVLLKRKAIASIILQSWAVIKIVVGGFFAMQEFSMTKKMFAMTMDASLEGAGAEAEKIAGTVGSAVVALGLGIKIVWLSALPVVLLIWLNRQKIKDQIAKW